MVWRVRIHQTCVRVPAARCARVVQEILHPGGCGECRVPNAPAALRAKVESTQASHHGRAGITRHSRTQVVLTVSSALSLVTGLSCHHRRRNLFHRLDASVGASGPHGFAVRETSAFVNALPASTASCPASVTISSRPSVGQDAEDVEVICLGREQKYFFEEDWTTQITLISKENFSSRRTLEAWLK
jgi:hypothetical protein